MSKSRNAKIHWLIAKGTYAEDWRTLLYIPPKKEEKKEEDDTGHVCDQETLKLKRKDFESIRLLHTNIFDEFETIYKICNRKLPYFSSGRDRKNERGNSKYEMSTTSDWQKFQRRVMESENCSEWEVFMGAAFGEDKRELDGIMAVWEDIFYLGVCQWVKNVVS